MPSRHAWPVLSLRYVTKVAEIDVKASQVLMGLDKLLKGAEDVEKMKVVLADEEIKLRQAEEATVAMLGKLEVSRLVGVGIAR